MKPTDGREKRTVGTNVEGHEEAYAARILTRRNFLTLSGSGLVGAAMLGLATPSYGQITLTYTSAHDLGIHPNNDGITNRENLVKALDYKSTNITFPPGEYTIDNSDTAPERGLTKVENFGNPPGTHYLIIVNHYTGELQMEKGASGQPDARFVFTTNTRRGMQFYGGDGAKFHGLRTRFAQRPTDRINSPYSMENVMFDRTSNTMVEDVDIDGSASAGLLFWVCARPSISRAVIKNTRADGLHFANCQDAEADDVYMENTGDDGLAFVNYDDQPANTGGRATNIRVKRSRARGIAVLGQSGVTIDGFTIDETSCSGIFCAYDSPWGTRVPSNVLFQNGTVTKGGAFEGAPDWNGDDWWGLCRLSTVRYGIYYEDVESVQGVEDAVEFKNIKVYSPHTRGVTGWYSGQVPKGTVRLTGIEVHDAGESGFDLWGKTLYLDDLTAKGANRYGIVVQGSDSVSYGKLTAINTSRTTPDDSGHARRAFGFGNNASVQAWTGELGIGPQELHVNDDQNPPTGYKVAHWGTQSGTMGKIYDGVINGTVQVEAHSPSALTYVDGIAPTVTAPAQSFVVPSTLGTISSVPVNLSWSGSDASGGSGIASYELEKSVNGGAYSPVPLPSQTATSVTLQLDPNTYRFRVHAKDNAGNTSEWAEGPSFVLAAHQENSTKVTYSPTSGRDVWKREALADSYGGYVTFATTAKSKARFTFTGRQVAWVSTMANNRGNATVYVDGVSQTTVDLYSGSKLARQTVFRKVVDPTNIHTLEVRPLGTKNVLSSGTRVDVDAFIVLS